MRSGAFTLHRLGKLPTHDASNGLRLFSRRLLDSVEIESTVGFTYSIELLVKAHRLGWRVEQVPARWFERKAGQSRFRVLKWLPPYLEMVRVCIRDHVLEAFAEQRPAAGQVSSGWH